MKHLSVFRQQEVQEKKNNTNQAKENGLWWIKENYINLNVWVP